MLTAACVAAVALVVFVFTFHPVTDPDTWFHLRLGRYILDTGTLPRVDPFSYTAGNTPYVPSGWATAVLMSWLDGLYPESSLWPILMVTFAVALAAGLVLWRGWRAGAISGGALLAMAGLTLAVTRFSPRPDVWSIPALTGLLFIMSAPWVRAEEPDGAPLRAAPRAGLLWLLPVLVAMWGNLHAGVLVALPFLAAYGAWLVLGWYRTRERGWLAALAPVAVACVAWLANPYGFGLLGLGQRIAQMPDVGWVMEWMPFFKSRFPLPWTAYTALGVLAALTAWLLFRRWRSFHPVEIVWLVFLFTLMLLQRRQVGLAGMGISLLLTRHLAAVLPRVWNGRKVVQGAAVGVAALALSAVQISGGNGNGGEWPRFGRNCTVLPCYTADFLKLHKPPAPIFNSYNFGGYLLNILWPETKVYIDGRLDTYPKDVWLDQLALEENRLSIDGFLKKYGVRTFVVTVKDSFADPMHLTSRLAARGDFALVYVDDIAAVFVRREPGTESYVKELGYEVLKPWDLKQMTMNLADAQMQQQAVAEMGRLLQESPASGAVHSLAAYIAWAAGDVDMANQQLEMARAIQPANELLRVVQNQLALAQARLRRR